MRGDYGARLGNSPKPRGRARRILVAVNITPAASVDANPSPPDDQAACLAQKLRETQSQLQMAAQLGRLGAWAFVVGQPCLTWSGEVCAIHDMPSGSEPTPEEAIGFFAPEYREHVAAVFSSCLANGSPFDIEGEIITARGRRVWVRALGEAEWDGRGIVRRLQGALQDISEGKLAAERELRMAEQLAISLEHRVGERTAQLEAANKDLEAFAYSIAHDLRAPLSSIDGFSKMLLQTAGDDLPEPGRHYLERIHAGVQQLAQLTDGMLALAHLSRTDLRCEQTDLSALAHAAVASCRDSEPGRDIGIAIADELQAYGDPRLLALAMTNLIANAWKFTAKTPGAKLEFARMEDAGAHRVYFVRDNGAGFDMTYADKLFEPFHRLHARTEYDGTGIGLAIARKVVTRHQGRIWAESAPGKGAAFFFTLPAA